MKRIIVHFVATLCVAGLVRADQTIQSVQQALKDQGFYYGEATGDKSAETTAAIRRYQIRNGLQVSGEINPETLRSLNLSSKSASSSQGASKSGVTQSNAVHRDDNSRVDQNSPPRSASAPDRRLEMTPGFFGPPYPAAPPRLSGRMIIAEVQRQLMNRGYYRGRIDGRYGPRTAFAMRAFQSGSGLPPTGHLDPSTLGALGLADSNLAYLESAPQLHEGRVPVWKFKHGKWKLKWKKLHRHKGDKYGDEDEGWNGDDLWHGEDHDD